MKSQARRILERLDRVNENKKVTFPTMEECQKYLDENFQGHGSIIDKVTGKTLRTCRCPFFAHKNGMPTVYLGS